jgi:hypothetical protein
MPYLHVAGEETKLLRGCWRPTEGCHSQPLPHSPQCGCQIEQVGAMGIQEQAARLLKVRREGLVILPLADKDFAVTGRSARRRLRARSSAAFATSIPKTHSNCSCRPRTFVMYTTRRRIRSWVTRTACAYCKISKRLHQIYLHEQSRRSKVVVWSFCYSRA